MEVSAENSTTLQCTGEYNFIWTTVALFYTLIIT